MNKLDFLKIAFSPEHKAYQEKAFLQSILAIHIPDDLESKAAFQKIPWAVYVEEGSYWYVDPYRQQPVAIEGDITQPLFSMNTLFGIDPDFHPFITEKIPETTFGIFLFNLVLNYEVFGDVIPYHNGEFTDKYIKGIIVETMVDDPEEGESVPPGKIPCSLHMRWAEHVNYLQGLDAYFLVTGSLDSLNVDPSILKRKAELFKIHKDELNDPVVFNNIIKELVDMDRKIQLSSNYATFFIDDKYISNARKRMFIAFGVEFNQETGTYVGLGNSLDEGWDMDHLVDYVNTAIDGFYDRGKATGEGGAGVKELLRLLGRISITENDCRSPVGEPVYMDEYNLKLWRTGYVFTPKGAELLGDQPKEKYLGKTVIMRVPQCCLVKDGNLCSVCAGSGLGSQSNRVSSEVVEVPTKFMLQRMKSSHLAGQGNTRLNLKAALRR